MSETIQTNYIIQTVEIENQGRHRLLLHGGPFAEIDPKAIRTLLARYLYGKVKSQPAFIFVYDRPEDLHYPLGFTVAKLVLNAGALKYQIEVRDRTGLQMPSEEAFRAYDAFQAADRNGLYPGPSLDAQNVNAYLYHGPVIKMEYTA